jgi:NTE family protein
MPLKIVSANIDTGEKRVFETGPVVDAIRSSISIPGIIMPNELGLERLVDGGIVNNLPVEILRGKNVIAVSVLRDVSRPIDMKLKVLGFEMNQSIF